MRFLALILFVSTFQLSASVYSQETRVTVHLQNASFEDVVKILEHSTDFTFLYRDHQVTGIRNLNLQYTNVDIKDVLDACRDTTESRDSERLCRANDGEGYCQGYERRDDARGDNPVERNDDGVRDKRERGI